MYTLILTIILSTGYADGGVSAEILKINDFRSKESCQAAGNLWLNNTKRNPRAQRSALCVSK